MNRKVKALLIKKGIKQKQIADALGITPGTVSGAIGGHYESRPVKEKVAQLLQMDYEKLWGKAA